MPRGVYERKPKEIPDMASEETVVTQKMFPVLLHKNYAPRGEYEIVGYLRPERKEKDSAGNMRVIEREEFIQGEMKPPQTPGVGYAGKVWAGTHISLPIDEAKQVIAKKIAERADDIAA